MNTDEYTNTASDVGSNSFAFCHMTISKVVRSCLDQKVAEDGEESVNASKVAVLMVPFLPLRTMIYIHNWWEWLCFTEVNHPYISFLSIMDKQQRTADHLLEKAKYII